MILTSVRYINHRYRFFWLLMRLTRAVPVFGATFAVPGEGNTIQKLVKKYLETITVIYLTCQYWGHQRSSKVRFSTFRALLQNPPNISRTMIALGTNEKRLKALEKCNRQRVLQFYSSRNKRKAIESSWKMQSPTCPPILFQVNSLGSWDHQRSKGYLRHVSHIPICWLVHIGGGFTSLDGFYRELMTNIVGDLEWPRLTL